MRFLLTFFFLIHYPQAALAFMNIESIRQTKREGTSGEVGAKANGQSGNNEKMSGELSTLTLKRAGPDEYLLAGRYRYGESRHVKDTHGGNLHLRYTHHRGPRPALEVFTQTEFDEFKLLKRRDLIGSGLRFMLKNEADYLWYLGTGLFYEHEDFEQNIGSEETVRANVYLSYLSKIAKNINATLILYYQPSLETFRDTRLQLDSALNIHLVERLALTAEYDIQYDSQPVAGVETADMSYLMGLKYAY